MNPFFKTIDKFYGIDPTIQFCKKHLNSISITSFRFNSYN